jgi:regulatory protein
MENQQTRKITDPAAALAKAEHFCTYQDRSQQEVRDKLYEWGLWADAAENIITQLIAGNFLNEERFAYAYTRGKFNQKGWGRNKIKQGLKFKKVSDVLIKKALKQLDEAAYLAMLTKILQKKSASLTEKDAYKRHYKLKQYALGRGYENDLIADVLKDSDL